MFDSRVRRLPLLASINEQTVEDKGNVIGMQEKYNVDEDIRESRSLQQNYTVSSFGFAFRDQLSQYLLGNMLC